MKLHGEGEDLDFSEEVKDLIKDVRWLGCSELIVQDPSAMMHSSTLCATHGQLHKG